MTLKHRFWAEYTARDFAGLDRENLIAVLPVGAIEQHGPHLPLAVDTAIVDGIVAATVPLWLRGLPIGNRAADPCRLPGDIPADDERGQVERTQRLARHFDPFGTDPDRHVVRDR